MNRQEVETNGCLILLATFVAGVLLGMGVMAIVIAQ